MKYVSLVLFGVWVLAEVLTAAPEPTSPDGVTVRSIAEATVAEAIVAAAKDRTTHDVRYDPAYVVLEYPGGDVPSDTGVCTDVVIRSYRALGVDLQKLVHEDMKKNFSAYPPLWGLRGPDRNIDHRRVPNLQRYLERIGAEVESDKFQPGDLIAWDLNGNGLWHIGIVVAEDRFVHNIGAGPVEDSGIEKWKIVGHYRFHPIPL